MRVFSMVLLAMFATTLAGCEDNPSAGQVQGWLASVKPGSSGYDAYDVLKSKGFDPHYENRTAIEGSRMTSQGTGVWVTINLDQDARVVSKEVVPFGNK